LNFDHNDPGKSSKVINRTLIDLDNIDPLDSVSESEHDIKIDVNEIYQNLQNQAINEEKESNRMKPLIINLTQNMRFEMSSHESPQPNKIQPIPVHIRMNREVLQDLNEEGIKGQSKHQPFSHTLHFGNCDLVVSEDFQTFVSDFSQEFDNFKGYFHKTVAENEDKLEVDLQELFIKQKAINRKTMHGGAANPGMNRALQEFHNKQSRGNFDLKKDQRMTEAAYENVLMKELRTLDDLTDGNRQINHNLDGTNRQQSNLSDPPLFSTFCLNGDPSFKDRHPCVVAVEGGGKHNLFDPSKPNRVKRVEIYTFEKNYLY